MTALLESELKDNMTCGQEVGPKPRCEQRLPSLKISL
jgi:hypothetical protein